MELRSNVELFETNKQSVFKNTFKLNLSTSNLVVKYPIKSIIEDFFLFNNSLSNNSKNLQKCSIQIRDVSVNFDSQGLKSTHF